MTVDIEFKKDADGAAAVGSETDAEVWLSVARKSEIKFTK